MAEPVEGLVVVYFIGNYEKKDREEGAEVDIEDNVIKKTIAEDANGRIERMVNRIP